MLHILAYATNPNFRATAIEASFDHDVLYSGIRPEARTATAHAAVTRGPIPRPRNSTAVSTPASAATSERRAQKHTLTACPSSTTANDRRATPESHSLATQRSGDQAARRRRHKQCLEVQQSPPETRMKAPSQPSPLPATYTARRAPEPPESPTPGPLPARDRLAPRLDPSQRPLAQPTYSSPFHGSAKTPDPDSAPTHASHRFDHRCQASTRSRAEARAYSPSHAEHGVVVAVQYQASAPLVPNSRRSAVTGSPDFL